MAEKKINWTIYAADFETTVYENQRNTEVWSSAFCPVRSVKQITGKRPVKQASDNDVIVHNSIAQSYAWLQEQQKDLILYYHNLKFDGSFWLDFLLKHGWTWWKRETKKDTPVPYTLETCISDLGQWYYIILYFDGFKVEMRDSLKLMPMSLRVLGKSFNTRHQKLEMDYHGHYKAGEPISPEELHYIKNDVLVLMEALEIMFEKGHTALTIGSCCMNEFKKSIPKMGYAEAFPPMQSITLNKKLYGSENADAFIRKAYRGGWCYAKMDRRKKKIRNGCTADVNSLYPSMMSSESGNRYPIGLPHFWLGEIPKIAKEPDKYYFLRLRCAFSLKDGYLPFMQIKSNPYYHPNEMLTDSRPRVHGHKYSNFYDSVSGEVVTDHLELTLTCTDWVLFQEHYNVYDLEILGGCWFYTDCGLFDEYIDKYRKIKIQATESGDKASRTLAKLFLNNLYGKMASSDNSSYKVPLLDETGTIRMQEIEEYKKKPVYIPVGAAITSYARNFTIRAAQKNYKYFCYADTDSIHCACTPDKLQGVPVDPVKFCCWKIETCWDVGWFVRAKTYIEYVTEEDQKPIEKPYLNVKCAGLPENCKQLLIQSMTETEEERQHHEDVANSYMLVRDQFGVEIPQSKWEEENFLAVKRTYEDFDRGLIVPGKLMPVRIPGGIILQETYFTLK